MTSFPKSEHATKWIPTHGLSVIWTKSQRRLDEKQAAKIAEEFDPDLFGVITVTLPNDAGIHHVIDGQTRVAAIRMLWGDNEKVPCNVLNVSDPVHAAHVFDKMNTSRKALQSIDRFKVRVTAGREIETNVNKIIVGLGYRVDNNQKDGTIRAVDACISIYKRFGPDALKSALLVIQGCWGKEPSSVEAPIVLGFAQFLSEYGTQIDKQRLVDRVTRQYTPARILGAAKGAREMFRGSLADNISRSLLNNYNHGLRSQRLDDAA